MEKNLRTKIHLFVTFGLVCLTSPFWTTNAFGTLIQTQQGYRFASLEEVLLIAAYHGDSESVKCLLEFSVDINTSDENQRTPLHLAAEQGHVETVNILLSEDTVRVDAVNNLNQTALMCAAASRSIIPNITAEQSLEIVQTLLNKGADPNIKDRNGCTPLHFAAQLGYVEIVKTLLSKDTIEVDAVNDKNQTPLIFAAASQDLIPGVTPEQSLEIVQALLNKGADPNIENSEKMTALKHAVREGYTDITRALLEKGAVLGEADNAGWTLLHYAAERDDIGIVELLLSQEGVDVDTVNERGNSALHHAEYFGHFNVVKVLLTHGANSYLKNKEGETPLDYRKIYSSFEASNRDQ